MKRLVLIKNDPKVDRGSIENNRLKVVSLNSWDNPWSSISPDDYVIILGGHMGAYDVKQYPYLNEEKKWIKNFVKENGRLLGICLGAQLLAEAIGGSAFLSGDLEFGIKNIKVRTNNTLLNIFQDAPLFTWHRDTFALPKNIDVIAETKFPQVYKHKSAIGLQFHPEITLNLFDTWINSEESKTEVESYGYKVNIVREEIALFEEDMSRRMNKFINAWLFDR